MKEVGLGSQGEQSQTRLQVPRPHAGMELLKKEEDSIQHKGRNGDSAMLLETLIQEFLLQMFYIMFFFLPVNLNHCLWTIHLSRISVCSYIT